VVADLAALSPAGFVVVVAIDAGVSLLIFRHADRHGSRHATAWGIFAFLFAGLAIPLYAVWYLTSRRRKL